MNIAIIPARGGSKRIPRKNIKEFCGKPMIAYAIKAAKDSGLFHHIIVSTDDEEIAKVARDFGAETPFIRPAELANDYVATVPVVAHAIQTCKNFGWHFDITCCIYPCAPFLMIEDLKNSFEYLKNNNNADYCFPVTEFPSVVQRGFKLLNNGKVESLYPEFELNRTQDIESTYYDAGQFYWGKNEAWLTNLKIHSNAFGYKIPNWRVVDIDSSNDWRRAEILAYNFKDFK